MKTGKGMIAIAFVIMLVATMTIPLIEVAKAEQPIGCEIILTSHLPIRINSNSDFTVGNGVSSGTGTSGDPYVIANWAINATGYGCGIYIGNTTKYTIILDCSIFDASGISVEYYGNSGIYLHTSGNITVFDNTITNNVHGIYLHTSSNISIDLNNINVSSTNGIILNPSSNYNNITNNNLNNSNNGLYLFSSTNNIIFNNNVTNSTIGIHLSDASNINNISNNTIKYSISYGIYSSTSSYLSILDNTITDSTIGIHLYKTTYSDIIRNDVSNSLNYDMYISSVTSMYNYIYHNNFLSTTSLEIAYNTGTNYWNSTHQFGGNYWNNYTGVDNYHGVNQDILGSDNIGDTPYIFTTGQDNYPLMEYYEVPKEQEEELTAMQIFSQILISIIALIILLIIFKMIHDQLNGIIKDDKKR
ncbi:right-handed parallel beta-helix repeat-containing protein [candidate division WOR-3 bacterium]|nr:right-handed parallel beta-helix repeat-containing protein [candidate division WOR-3 bacterium]